MDKVQGRATNQTILPLSQRQGSQNISGTIMHQVWFGLVWFLYSPPCTITITKTCLLYTSPSPRDRQKSRMPSSA